MGITFLALLVALFLLMPIAAETELEEQRQQAAEKDESATALQHTLQDRLKELYKLEELRPDLKRVDELRKEIDLLRSLAQKSLQQSLAVRVIETDPKTGAIFYYDPGRGEQPMTPIADAAAARTLIEQHRKEAQGRSVYYQFLRRRGPFPNIAQGRQHRDWFKDVPNSLEVQP